MSTPLIDLVQEAYPDRLVEMVWRGRYDNDSCKVPVMEARGVGEDEIVGVIIVTRDWPQPAFAPSTPDYELGVYSFERWYEGSGDDPEMILLPPCKNRVLSMLRHLTANQPVDGDTWFNWATTQLRDFGADADAPLTFRCHRCYYTTSDPSSVEVINDIGNCPGCGRRVRSSDFTRVRQP